MAINKFDIEQLKKIFVPKGGRLSQIINSVISWGNISGKPSTFPPSSHSHVAADITDLNEGLVGTKEVDETSIADDKILVYKTASGKYELENKPSGSGVQNNFSATAAPTETDDSSNGYSVGSVWIDVSADKIYQCADSTNGAAIWKQLNSVILDDAPSDGETYGRKNGVWSMIDAGAGLVGSLIPSIIYGTSYQNSVINPEPIISISLTIEAV